MKQKFSTKQKQCRFVQDEQIFHKCEIGILSEIVFVRIQQWKD